jgi:ribosome biogenesis protein BMS1
MSSPYEQEKGPQTKKPFKKKRDKDAKKKNPGKDPRAFALTRMGRVRVEMQRSADLVNKRIHVPVRDRLSEVDAPPPVVVAVCGPSGVGKTTLIKSLVKHYTKQNLSSVVGPVTVVASKTRRLTFVECPNELTAMLDTAKVADLVMLLVDAKFGFEMEQFELLNMLQTHGFPKVMGVLTHLDLFKTPKQMRDAKKALKRRFWTEVYDGAKLFNLSGIEGSRYPKTDVINLARFISTQKFRPLIWRNTHPYLVADRFEDVTHPQTVSENPATPRTAVLYGWTRGSPLKKGQAVHLPGVGDFVMSEVSVLDDPCALPTEQKQRSLNQQERVIYGPMSDLGSVFVDKDAAYVSLSKPSLRFDAEAPEKTEGEQMVLGLQQSTVPLDDALEHAELRLFSGSNEPLRRPAPTEDAAVEGEASDEEEEEEEEQDEEDDEEENGSNWGGGEGDDDEQMDDEEEEEDEQDDEEEEEDALRTKMRLRGMEAFAERKQAADKKNLMRLVYETNQHSAAAAGGEQALDEDEFFTMRTTEQNVWDRDDCFRVKMDPERLAVVARVAELAQKYGKGGAAGKMGAGSDEEVEDDFEILENSESSSDEEGGAEGGGSNKLGSNNNAPAEEKEEDNEEDMALLERLKALFTAGRWEGLGVKEGNNNAGEEMEDEGEDEKEDGENDGDDDSAERRLKEKRSKKEQFVEELEEGKRQPKGRDKFFESTREAQSTAFFDTMKDSIKQEAELVRNEFASLTPEQRYDLLGIPAGKYVRIVLHDVPAPVVANWDGHRPLIVGGIAATDGMDNPENPTTGFGFIKTRMKRHRWYGKILKSGNPLIVSVGWRRYETCPIFSKQDHGEGGMSGTFSTKAGGDTGERNRFLKVLIFSQFVFLTYFVPLVHASASALHRHLLRSAGAGQHGSDCVSATR